MAGHIKLELKHDSEGFLIGDKVDLREQITLLKHIKDDISTIKNHVANIQRSSSVNTNKAKSVVSYSRSSKPANQSYVSDVKLTAITSSASRAIGKSRSEPSVKKPSSIAIKQSPKVRDSRGRFIKNGSGVGDDSHGSLPSLSRGVSEGLSKLSNLATNAGQGMEEADPTVKAFREVAEPLGRGMQFLGGMRGERNKERWYRRFWKGLSESWKNESKHQKQERKYLKNIDEQTRQQGEGGFLSGLMSFLPLLVAGLGGIFAKGIKFLFGPTGPLRFLSKIGKALAGITLLDKLLGKGKGGGNAPGDLVSGGAGRGKGGKVPKGLGKIGRALRGLRGIPILSSLVAAGFTYWDLKQIDEDETLTSEEKNVKKGGVWGGLGGGLAGSFAGAKLGGALGFALGSIFPGVGNVIGGAIGSLVGGVAGFFLGEEAGEIVGSKLGEFYNEFKSWDISGKIFGIFNELKTWITSKWDTVTNWINNFTKPVQDVYNQAKEAVSNAIDTANQSAKDITGVDVKETIAGAYDNTVKAVTDATNGANDWVKDKTGIDVKAGGKAIVDIVTNPIGAAKKAMEDTVTKSSNVPAASNGGVFYPVSGNPQKVRSKYGELRNKSGGGTYRHGGTDFVAAQGSNVLSMKSGKVINSGYQYKDGHGWGNYIKIQHDDGTSALYAHLSKMIAKIGDTVKAGQVIALSGGDPNVPGAGSSTGPHLHVEAWDDKNRKIDPESLLKPVLNTASIQQSQVLAKNQSILSQPQPPLSVVTTSTLASAFNPVPPAVTVAYNDKVASVPVYQSVSDTSKQSKKIQVAVIQEVGQSISDRKISHIVTGGGYSNYG